MCGSDPSQSLVIHGVNATSFMQHVGGKGLDHEHVDAMAFGFILCCCGPDRA